MSEDLALKMEYLMLGGISDKKDNIDVEIIDCVSEMICDISGSFSTNLNAHYEDHMGCTKFIWCDAQHIILEENQNVHNLHEISFKMNDELFKFYIDFDDHMKTFLNMKIKNKVPNDINALVSEEKKKEEKVQESLNTFQDDIFGKMMNSFILTLESLFSSSIKKIAYGKIIESSIVKNSKLVEHFVEPSHINSIKVNENGYILSKMDFTSVRTLISKMLEDSYNDISSKDILSPIESNLIKMFDYQMVQRLNEFLGVLILSKLSIEKTTWDIGSIGYMGLDIENYFVSFSFDLDGKKCEFTLCFPKYLLSQYIDKFEEIKGV
jgi:hypothetical protein